MGWLCLCNRVQRQHYLSTTPKEGDQEVLMLAGLLLLLVDGVLVHYNLQDHMGGEKKLIG